ncbi:PQQ-binding-like beta-propeller repeat protein [Haliangium sp. UPWRP_2]|uniref:outer membrane protein assembly factor BamB family protein n=1 Tax=Haliangium sp. UPWRP_2 TaxID=1931276 RepID=UPI000D0CB78F|nr:PQQ-binding-like beta-propeller repeat protein [Haliangium sp. UPWRP_2]PSM30919.1 hypothetical protein BVG81_008045 [Haliangium sp. UPWRP_2]
MSTKRVIWSLSSGCCLALAVLGSSGCGEDGGPNQGAQDNQNSLIDQSYQLQSAEDDWADRTDWRQQQDWPMYNYDSRGSRWNRAETRLNPRTVARLRVLWRVTTPAAVSGTPVVVDDSIYVGDGSGQFYALDRSGQLRWQRQLAAGITGSALVYKNRVIFGDQGGTIYGLDRGSGALLWQVRPNPHVAAAIYGSPTLVGDRVAVGIASNEEVVAADPNYPCCNFRGSVVMLDPVDGAVRWQTYLISLSEQLSGSAGAAVWSTPTYDEESGSLYVSTSNNYTEPTTGKSDAIIALDARTGQIRWTNQRTPNDSWNIRYPFSTDHPDADFGDSPQVYKLHGRKVVGAGQKSGFYHVLDAATGVAVNQIQVQPGGLLGGLFADSAVAQGVAFAPGNNWTDTTTFPPLSGALVAIAGDGSRELWRFTTPASVNIGGIAVAGGVVYFQSLMDDGLYALDASSGRLLTRVATGHGSSGPAVCRGNVYVGTGSFYDPPGTPGSIVALGL